MLEKTDAQVVPEISIYEQRLRNLIVALREHPKPEAFTMEFYAYSYPLLRFTPFPCGTPACVLGTYAARPDLQSDYAISDRGFLMREGCVDALGFDTAHFGITPDEVTELFSTWGCGDARTPAQAIAYIEKFIERKHPAEAP